MASNSDNQAIQGSSVGLAIQGDNVNTQVRDIIININYQNPVPDIKVQQCIEDKIRELEALFFKKQKNSSDYGVDEPSSQALLQRHKDLQGELNAYSGDIRGDIHSLNQQADKLIAAGNSTLDLTAEPDTASADVEEEERVQEPQLVPTEVREDVPVERTEQRTVLEERSIPQVEALYPFSEEGMSMTKGEVMFLLNKTNAEWWCVRKADGSDGFVPANYVREISAKIITIKVKRPL